MPAGTGKSLTTNPRAFYDHKILKNPDIRIFLLTTPHQAL